jgi:hypothetical protein
MSPLTVRPAAVNLAFRSRPAHPPPTGIGSGFNQEKSSLLLSSKKEESSFLKKRSKRLFIIGARFRAVMISIGWMEPQSRTDFGNGTPWAELAEGAPVRAVRSRIAHFAVMEFKVLIPIA